MHSRVPHRCRFQVERLEDRTVPTAFVVTNLNDSGAGSFRAAILSADSDRAPDTISFDKSIQGGTIHLTTFVNPTVSTTDNPQPGGPSAFFVHTRITIDGTGETLTRDTAATFRLFQVAAAGDLSLRFLTLSNGLAQGSPGLAGGGAAGLGGAILNQGSVRVFGCTILGNRAIGGSGGAVGAAGGGGLGSTGDIFGAGGSPNGSAAGKGEAGGFGGGGGTGANGATGEPGEPGGRGGFGAGGGEGGGGSFETEGVVSVGFPGGRGGAGGFGGGGAAGGGGGPGSNSGPGGLAGFGGGAGSTGPGGIGGNVGGGAGAGLGGGIFNQGGLVSISSSTITGNTALGGDNRGAVGSTSGPGSGFGGGIFNLNGQLVLGNATIASNIVVGGAGTKGKPSGQADGGAVYNLSFNAGTATMSQSATLTIANSILANSQGGVDLVNNQGSGTASVDALSANIVSKAVTNSGGILSGSPITVVNPLLGSLGINGGPTATIAPQPGSPAIDAGTSAAVAATDTDQRGVGFVRLSNGLIDLGAVEIQVPVVVAPATLPDARAGVVYSQTVSASGPPAPYAFAVTTGTLPAGLTLSAAGDLTGTPTAAGTADFTVSATNTTSEVGSKTYHLMIAAAIPSSPPGLKQNATPFLIGGLADGSVRLLAASLGDSFAALPGFGVNARTAVADVTGDGVADIIVGAGPGAPGGHIAVLDGTTHVPLVQFNAFEDTFTGGVFVAAADIDGDKRAEVVVTPDESGGPIVAIYRGLQLAAGVGGQAAQLTRYFGIAGDPNFRGGCRPALGDVNGDGAADLVVSAGVQGGPRIALFDGRSLAAGSADPGRLVGDFFAFEDTLRNGAFVAAGDVTGDGRAEVAFGGGPGGAPRVRLFDGAKLLAAPPSGNVDGVAAASQLANFFAGDPGLRGGVRLALHDLDGDDRAELAAGSGAGEPSRVSVYRPATVLAGAAAADQEFDPFGMVLTNGVFVG